MSTFTQLADLLLTHLFWASLQAVVLVGIVALILRLRPRLSAATRCLLWWLLGAQLLLGVVWQAPVRLPMLAPAPETVSVTQGMPPTSSNAYQRSEANIPADRSAQPPASEPATWSHAVAASLPWQQTLLALWLAGVLAQLVFTGRQWQCARRVRRTARPLDDPYLRAVCAGQAHRLGLRRCPELHLSDAIKSPQVTGFWHPLVLLPARHGLTSDECAMALSHELAHLRRGDLWLSWIPTLARWLFFFHPLVHLAVREYALNRETACDGQAVRLQRVAPQAYGQLLLRLGVELSTPVGFTGVASPSFRHLKRRLILLQHAANTVPRARDWLLVALVALAFVIPYRVVAAEPGTPSTHHAARTLKSAFEVRPRTSQPPPLPSAPPKPSAPNYGFHPNSAVVDIDSNAHDGIALFSGGLLIIHGTQADANAAKRLRKTRKPLLWFRHGKQAYIVYDADIIRHAKAAFAPVDSLAKQQDSLSGRQSELGGQQSGLAARQSALALRQSALATQQAKVARLLASTDSTPPSIEHRQRSLSARQQALRQQHAEISRRQSVLGKKQSALGQQQSILGQRQQLAFQQAMQHVNKLMNAAIAKGLAKPVLPN